MLDLSGGDGVYMVVEGGDVFLPAVMEEAFAEVEGELLAVVAGDTYLSFDLFLGCLQLVVGEGLLHEAVELAAD